ncbi:glycosyltransferase involved in cell wall biosynthesis [Nitrospirillum viridazoti]|uniref:Glycosyltransferase involved in cell wall biosynthesis n=2 Tax=Nitrospirillum TaxID=1543705 RepID=A0A560INU9_9PROT|nr:glycosyltransferase involved in cell wall biosynthesis [Nitrospirillum amazonense]
MCRRRGDAMRAIIGGALSPRERAIHWRTITDDAPLRPADFMNALEEASVETSAGWAIAFSHDHYLTTCGGAQNCINDEETALRAGGWAYLHFCPVQPLPLLSDVSAAADMRLLASLNGRRVGVVTMADVMTALTLLERRTGTVVFIIHHLLGHAPELIAEAVATCPKARTFFWAHDLFALCPSIHLLRNDAAFCGAPPLDSGACGICVAGEERPGHSARMRRFLETTQPTLLAPSDTILQLWRQRMDFSGPSLVLSPCGVDFAPYAPVRPEGGPLRVGFLGGDLHGKGWTVFAALAAWHRGDSRYAFFQLGTRDLAATNVTHVHAEVSRSNRQAMVEAVGKTNLDVVINWSLFYESFSFTAIEAAAGGAFVIARKSAGNVWPLISGLGPSRGVAVETEIELQAMFVEGRVLDLAAQADRRRGRLTLNCGAGSILL